MDLGPSGHIDPFTRDRLPIAGQWPDMPRAGFAYPEWLNVGVELTDGMVAKGFGDMMISIVGLLLAFWLVRFLFKRKIFLRI